jgi:hypothetical protein
VEWLCEFTTEGKKRRGEKSEEGREEKEKRIEVQNRLIPICQFGTHVFWSGVPWARPPSP